MAVGAGTTWAVTRGDHATAARTPPPSAAVTPAPAVLATAETPKPAPAPEPLAKPAPPKRVAISAARHPTPPAPATPGLPTLPAMSIERSHALDDLDRCIAGDGKGCNAVGRWFEGPQNDAYSASKWYEKGCELSNLDACAAVDRLGHLPALDEHTVDDPLAHSTHAAGPGPDHQTMNL